MQGKIIKASLPISSASNYSYRKDWVQAVWHQILKSEYLLELLVTSYERRNIVTRAAVMDRVNSGKRYRHIAEELWLSSQTISGIKKAIQRNGYRSYRERGKTERKKKTYGSTFSVLKKKKPQYREGRAHRTKYGTIYI